MHLLIEGALKSRGVARFVFTCRPRLNYEHPAFFQIELHGLSVEEARQLFRARGVNVEVKDIDELHELTQGHPLWLNLIATQVLTNQSDIHQFIARIKSGKDAGLARRDSGEVDEALGYFLHGLTLDVVLKPKEILSGRGGSYYGNIGRCLFFKGDFENAQICLIKSASSLEKERNELMLLNQGYAGLWLGELLEKRQESRMAYVCYMRAANKWKLVSPPRAEKVLAAAQLLSDKDKQFCDLKDWEIERIYTDWLDKVAVFTSAA